MTFTATGYGEDGAPQPISGTFGGGIYSHRERLNYDRTLTPTLLLHLGAGYDHQLSGPAFGDSGLRRLRTTRVVQRGVPTARHVPLAHRPLRYHRRWNQHRRTSRTRRQHVLDCRLDRESDLGQRQPHFQIRRHAEFQGSYTITVSNLSGTYGFSPRSDRDAVRRQHVHRQQHSQIRRQPHRLAVCQFPAGRGGYRRGGSSFRSALRKAAVGILCAGQLEGDAQADAGSRPALRLFDLVQGAVRALSRISRRTWRIPLRADIPVQ